MENVAGEQGLPLFNNFLHTNLLILLKFQTLIKSHFFNDGGLKSGHFDICDRLFPFLALTHRKYMYSIGCKKTRPSLKITFLCTIAIKLFFW